MWKRDSTVADFLGKNDPEKSGVTLVGPTPTRKMMRALCETCSKTGVNVSSLVGTIVAWQAATGVHFWTPDDRRFAAALAVRILFHSEKKWDQKLAQVGVGQNTPLHLVGEPTRLLSEAVDEYRGGSTLPPR
jgi:hypothetical protein